MAILVAALVVGVVVTTGGSNTPTTPSTASDQALLKAISVTQSDVGAGTRVAVISGGNKVAGQVTLDLCGGHFPSEALRVARHQVAAVNETKREAFSTEAVLYGSPADTAQVFTELQHAAATCPSSFVTMPEAGAPPIKTVFNAPPDGTWPKVAGVDRLAYDATVSDQKGDSERELAVYLRRGPYLLGLYFNTPTALVPVDGQTTMAGITAVFEHRLASAPFPS